LAPRKKTKIEKFFSFNQHRRRFDAPNSVGETQDIVSLKNTLIPGKKKVYTHGSSKNLKEHLKNLRGEFIGDPELCYVVAKKIVLIRRESKLRENFQGLEALLKKEGDFLFKKLNLRWLISIADTISEHSQSPEERALALCATILGNTVKIYETERFLEENETSKSNPERLKLLQSSRVPLIDGMSGFCIGTDDTLRNMFFRMNTSCQGTYVGKLVQEVFRRLQSENTGYSRLKNKHTRPRTSWW
tara:strand:+ start:1470 stop:2204 length:735 start_codon:yes stop_codon:yes gene_type:complete